MKTSGFFILLLIMVFLSCKTSEKTAHAFQTIEVTSQDSLEYQLIITDSKFESFLAIQPMAEYYSQLYYENWNRRYVAEWNIRHNNPIRYGSFYQTEINYNSNTDYGLDLNYRLYYFFQFVEKEYGIQLLYRGK